MTATNAPPLRLELGTDGGALGLAGSIPGLDALVDRYGPEALVINVILAERAAAAARENRDVARRLHLAEFAEALAAGWVLS